MLRHPGIYIRRTFYKTGHVISISTDFKGNVRWKQQPPSLKKKKINLSITSRTESDWSCYYVWTVQKNQAFPKWFRKSPRTNYCCDKMDEKRICLEESLAGGKKKGSGFSEKAETLNANFFLQMRSIISHGHKQSNLINLICPFQWPR